MEGLGTTVRACARQSVKYVVWYMYYASVWSTDNIICKVQQFDTMAVVESGHLPYGICLVELDFKHSLHYFHLRVYRELAKWC